MKAFPVTLGLLLSATLAFPQTQDSTKISRDSIAHVYEDIFTHEDSLDIFELIDSLLKLEPEKGTSQLAVRLGYNSNITADNRTFNITQFGLAPGVSYYHKSGAYADVTSYWSQEYKPNLYLSVGSAGYIWTAKKFYSVLVEYSHYFYYDSGDSTVSVPYTNNLGITNFFDVKPFIFRLDYYFYFGDKTAHRIIPNVGANFVVHKWLGFDKITFYPNTSVMFGSEQITDYQLYPNLLLRYIYNQTHTPKLPLYYEVNHTEFGVMNYAVSMPISFTKKQWTFLLNYSYNFPKALPGEDLSLQDGGFLSFSVTRYINLRQSK